MAALTPKRAELARQIRAASAQLRSPAVAPPARSAADIVNPLLTGILGARRRLQEEAEANDEGYYAQDAAPPGCGAPPTGEGRRDGRGADSVVDMRALRLQMERSLARLQSGELTPPPASHGAGTLAESAPVDWALHVAEHCCWRRARVQARAALLHWLAVAGREKRASLEQLASRLQQELDEAEMQLADCRDPARTQALDELSLRLIDKDMELEKEQEERETERAQWQKAEEEYRKALQRARDERTALEQLLDEEREAQLERERKWESKAKEAANEKGSKERQNRAMEAAHGQMGETTRGREAVERELEAFLMKEREELEKEQSALQQEHIRERQAMADLRESIVKEKESLAQERMKQARERDQIALAREQLRETITGALSRQAIVYSKKMCKQAFFCRWLRVGLFLQQKAAADDCIVLQQNEVMFEHQPQVLVDKEYECAKGKRQQRRVARLWASAKVRLKDKMLLMLVCSRWNVLAVRYSRRRAVKAQRVNLTHERRQHVLGAALWTWKSSTRKSFTLADPLCRARVGVFAPVDVCCNRNMSGQAASSAARFAWRQDPANATGAMHTAARTSGPRGRGGRERGVEGKSLESSSVACAAAVNSIPTSDATVTSPTPSPLFASYSSSSSASMTSPLRQCGVLEELRVGEKGKDGVSGGCASSGAQVTRTPLTMLLETLDNCRAASDSCVPDNIHTKGATKGRVDRHVVSRARAHMNNVASDDDKENVRGGVTGEGLPEGMDVTSVRTGVRQVPGRLCTVRETTIKTGVCGNSNSNVKVLRLSDTREPGREGEKWARDAGGGGGGGGKERHGIGGGASGVVHVGTQRQNAETVGLARHAAWRGLVGRGFDAESASVKGTTIHESLRAAEDALLMLLTSP